MFGVIMPLCNRMFCCIFVWYFYIEMRLKYEKNILLSRFFNCLPLWKTVLFVSSRAFSLSTPVDNSEARWKKATKCNKWSFTNLCLLCFRLIDCEFASTSVSAPLFTYPDLLLGICCWLGAWFSRWAVDGWFISDSDRRWWCCIVWNCSSDSISL